MEEEQKKTTALYRRQACFLLSSAGEQQLHDNYRSTLTSRDIQSSLGHRSLLEEHDVGTSNTKIQPLATETSSSSSFAEEQLDMNATASVFHCHGCGCWLQPGINVTIRLRSVGRGRTRRRRASRRKAAKLVAKQQASVSGGRQFSQSIDERLVAELNELHNVTDGTIRNCIVYTCQTCGTQQKAKGILIFPDQRKKTRQKPSVKRKGAANTKQATNQNPKYNTKQMKLKTETETEKTAFTAAALEENLDFVPLTPTTKIIETKKRTKISSDKRVIQEPGKKKRRKGEQQQSGKPSKLLNFLSSLND